MALKALRQMFEFSKGKNSSPEEEMVIDTLNVSKTSSQEPAGISTASLGQTISVLKSIERVDPGTYDQSTRSAIKELCQTDQHLSYASFNYKQVTHSTRLRLCQADHSSRLASFKSLLASSEDGCEICTIWRDGIRMIFPDDELSDAEFFWCLQTWDRMVPITKTHSELEIFTTLKPIPWLPGLPRAQIPPGDTADDSSVATLRRWLNDCFLEHSLCGMGDPQPLPTRILEVGLNKGCIEIKLCVPKAKQSAHYVCLSHCWGSTLSSCRTTKASTQQHIQSINWETMPKTFRDAAIVTQKLGLKYLWIDSLCIVQDDPVDWQVESCKMADIYENSYLTLAATSSADDDGGLFFRQSAEYASHKVKVTGPEGQQDSIYIRRRLPHSNSRLARHPMHEVDREYPLFHRAWTFQELLLSSRVVHFSKEELVWECKQCADCQCSPPGPCVISYPAHFEKHDPLLRWQELVKEFSGRVLSFEKDKLPALSGAAKASPQWKQGQRYLAGLWEHTLLFDLLWEPLNKSESCRTWRAPSWSWASINGGVRFCSGKEIHQQYARVISSVCIPNGLDPTGEVSSGVIVLSGPLVRVTLSPKEGRQRNFVETLDDQHFQFLSDYDLNKAGSRQIVPGSNLYCLRLFTFRHFDTWKPGLTPTTEHRQDVCLVLHTEGAPLSKYRRIGLIETYQGISRNFCALFEGAITQNVTII